MADAEISPMQLDYTQQNLPMPSGCPVEAPASTQEVAISQPSSVPVVAVPADAQQSMMNFIAMALERPEIDAGKLKALLDMQREVAADDAKMQFNRALHAAQSEMPRVKKNGTIDLGGKGQIKFATFEDVDAVVRPIAHKHGFSYTFSINERSGQGGGGIVIGQFRHVAGHSESLEMPLPLDSGPGRNNLQAMGSTFNYGKRYLVESFFSIVREGADDDGVRGGTVYIDADTVIKITDELNRRKIPFGAFCDVLGVRSVEEIEVKNLPAARNALKSYKPREPAPTP